ncbi:MAG: uroporphyrinogen-III C-methyltransferase [Ardenticatenaceae bacterium]
MNLPAKVYLVGAGPGDPGLLTLRGAELLEQAEVVVYDRLANPALLKLLSEEAERIYVGKLPHRPRLKQDQINELLVQKGRAGKLVVRLKGGDPFVFGHGGEEGEALHAAGVRFEVVPGVTSAVAVPAYAGVPLTHPDQCSAFVVISGHQDPTRAPLDYNALARLAKSATLVILMGVRRLRNIVEALQTGGLPANTPVATTQWGTRSQQRTATGTLATIVEELTRMGISSPAVTVIGGVVSYRETLRWFDRIEERPLLGKRVVVTRPRPQANAFCERLRALGAEPIEVPAIRILPPADEYAALDAAIAQLAKYDWLVFTSVNGVAHFWPRLTKAGKDTRALGQARIAAIGTATAQELQKHGIIADLIPKRFVAESLLEALIAQGIAGKQVLLPRADIARRDLHEGLLKAGTHVTEAHAYRTVIGQPDAETLTTLQQGVDIITFTSSSTVRHFIQLLGTERTQQLTQHAAIAAIGPITAQTARQLGLRVDIQAETYTIAGLVDALVNYQRPPPQPLPQY